VNDADIIKWLNHWLVKFSWNMDAGLCTLTFKDPYDHWYDAAGADLRECVANAVKRHPTSATFIGIECFGGS